MLESMPEGKVDNPVFEVIGVVSNTRNQGIQDPALPELYIPYTMTGTFDRARAGPYRRQSRRTGGRVCAARSGPWTANVALTFYRLPGRTS